MKTRIFQGLILLVFCGVGHAGVPLSDQVSVEFASKEQAGILLAQPDDYNTRLSEFDLTAKPQVTQPVTVEEFRRYQGDQGMAWSAEEQQKFAAIFESIREPLAPFVEFLPSEVILAKTTGNEEAGAFYTRGDAIFIPQQVMGVPAEGLASIMLHELFHVLSRHNPNLRDELYASIGFVKTTELQLPSPLDEQKITNPDVPVFQHLIQVGVDGEKRWAAPIIYSDTPYDPEKERSFFPYIKLQLLIYDWDGESAPVAASKDGKPYLEAFENVEGFFEQIGQNTSYLFHAEEILAENFTLLVQGGDIMSPEILDKMGSIFESR